MPAKRVSPARKLEKGARIRPFADSLPMLLVVAREAVMRRFRPHLRAHGMSDQQWRIVRALAEAGTLGMKEIGRYCMILPASLTQMLPKLAAMDIVSLAKDPLDQRRVIVSLTPAGRAVFKEMGKESERIYAEIRRDIGPGKLEALYKILEQIPRLLLK